MAADGSVTIDVALDESGLKKSLSKLGDIVETGLKNATVGVTALTAAFGALTVKALKLGGDLEQSIGGIETLFKKNADTVIANSKRAYETAGVDANSYMQQVTSFSASLLQSLGGDTEKAAKVADMAIIDMADNANKMGTSVEMIQNAYQGFAKQNYTMLDNLKLGYGGTKTEMERLLADAQKISGTKYDISNLNDVYQAIHIVQVEMGITGTTAKEAASTLQGSISMTKSAFNNFLMGVGTTDEFVNSFVNLADIVIDRLSELVPRLAEGLGEIAQKLTAELAERLTPVIPQGFKDFFQYIVDNGQTVITVLAGITSGFAAFQIGTLVTQITAFITAMGGLSGILTAVGAALSALASPVLIVAAAVGLLVAAVINLWNTNEDFRNNIISSWENILDSVGIIIDSIVSIFNGFVSQLIGSGDMQEIEIAILESWKTIETGVSAVLNAILKIVEIVFGGIAEFLKNNSKEIENILVTTWNIIWSIIKPIWETIDSIAIKIFGELKKFFDEWGDDIQVIFKNSLQLVFEIFKAAWDKIELFWKTFGPAITSSIQTTLKNIQIIFDFAFNQIMIAVKVVMNTISGIIKIALGLITGDWGKAWEGLQQIFYGWKDGIIATFENFKKLFTGLFGNFVNGVKDLGANIIRGFTDGMVSMFDSTIRKIQNFVENIKDLFTGVQGFDIHSPSKWGIKKGKEVPKGWAIGIDENANLVLNAQKNLMSDLDSLTNTNYNLSANIGTHGRLNGYMNSNANTSTTTNNSIAPVLHQTNNFIVSSELDANAFSRKINQQTMQSMRNMGVIMP